MLDLTTNHISNTEIDFLQEPCIFPSIELLNQNRPNYGCYYSFISFLLCLYSLGGAGEPIQIRNCNGWLLGSRSNMVGT